MSPPRALLVAALAALVAAAAAPAARALVPHDRVLFVAAPLSNAPWARASARVAATYAQTRLGYRPEKVLGFDQTLDLDALTKLLRDGAAQKALQQDDLVVLYLAGTPDRDADKLGAWIRGVPDALRRKGSAAAGLFHGNALVLLDHALAQPPGGLDNATAIVLEPPGRRGAAATLDQAVLLGGGADRKLALAGQALEVCGEPCTKTLHEAGGAMSRGLARWLGAMERLATDRAAAVPDTLALREALSATSGEKPERFPIAQAASYRANDYRLLAHELTVLLDTLIPTPDSQKAITAIRDALRARASVETRSALKILGPGEDPGSLFVACEVLADDRFASIHCEDQRQRRVFDAQDVDASVLPSTIEELADHLLNRYGALQVHHKATLQVGRKPAFVLFLADNSTSMAYNDPTSVSDPEATNHESKRETAAFRLIESLGGQAARLGRPTRFGMVTFSDAAQVVRLGSEDTLELDKPPPAGEQKRLREAIHASVAYHGGTNLLAPLEEARKLVEAHAGEYECHVILLTDGRDTAGKDRKERRRLIFDEARALKALGASLHTVGLTETSGSLADYLRRLREGGDTYDVYAGLYGSSKRNGRYHAKMIRKVGFHDPVLLDKLRLGDGRVKAGAFVQPGSTQLFQKQFEEVVTLITGGGVYSSRKAVRQRDPFDPSVVIDYWQFDIDLRTEAQIVLYNPEGLVIDGEDGWSITRDDAPVKPGSRHFSIRPVGESVTEVILSAPARGRWRIRRTGRLP